MNECDFASAEHFLRTAKEAQARGDEQLFNAARALVLVALGIPLTQKDERRAA